MGGVLQQTKISYIYKRLAKAFDCKVIAIGHTADDLIETYLMHLVRGSGLRGLSFSPIDIVDDIKIIRPIWNISKSDIVKFLDKNNIPYSIDSTNNSLQFTRNKVRHILLPI